MAEMGDPPGQGQLIVHGEAGPRKKKMINLLNRSPSPVILEDYGIMEPTRCTVGGPGIAGGIVGVPTQVTVTARDASHVHIREGGERFILEMKHTGKGNEVKKYDSTDHGDGHYTFSGVRADLKGMHQLSVEVNGTLVGDSPYLVMFEIDDDAELTTENADGTMPVARQSAATTIKERIAFVQRMNPAMTQDGMLDIFAKFGRVMKCEKMLPAHDIWMLQYSRAEDAAEAITVNGTEVMGCQVNVALASNLGGVGTHPTIMQQLQHIQAMHFQEQQSTSWATQLAAQRASIRLAGGEVEELTDTRKRRKAVALMQRLQAKVEHAKIGGGGGGHEGAVGSGADGTAGSGPAAVGEARGVAEVVEDLRHRPRDPKERSKSRDRDRGRNADTERDRKSKDRERERDRRSREREREHENERRDRRVDRSREGGEQGHERMGLDRRGGERDRREYERSRDWERDRGRDREMERRARGASRDQERRCDDDRREASRWRGEERRGGPREADRERDGARHKEREKAASHRSRDRDAGGGTERDRDRTKEERSRNGDRSRGRQDAEKERRKERAGGDKERRERGGGGDGDAVREKKDRHEPRRGSASPARNGGSSAGHRERCGGSDGGEGVAQDGEQARRELNRRLRKDDDPKDDERGGRHKRELTNGGVSGDGNSRSTRVCREAEHDSGADRSPVRVNAGGSK